MSGVIVVDVGNTCVKWGRCSAGRVAEVAVLPPNAPDTWERQFEQWAGPASAWVVSGVHPGRRDTLVAWLRDRAATIRILDDYRQLPLDVRTEVPAQVGIDRLLNAVAANARRRPNHAAVIVDAGSAVTVDLVDDRGAFRGGAIAPGLRLMALALHDHTALLPAVAVDGAQEPPGTTTVQAIRAGVFHCVLGGIVRLVAAYRRQWRGGIDVFVTGGDGALLLAQEPGLGVLWPAMTLAGILYAVAGAPNDG